MSCTHLIQVDIGLQILMKSTFRMVLNLKILTRCIFLHKTITKSRLEMPVKEPIHDRKCIFAATQEDCSWLSHDGGYGETLNDHSITNRVLNVFSCMENRQAFW